MLRIEIWVSFEISLLENYFLFRFDGEWAVEAAEKNALNGDLGLVLKSKAKHAAISSRFKKPFVFKDSKKPLILQYEINYQVRQINNYTTRSL